MEKLPPSRILPAEAIGSATFPTVALACGGAFRYSVRLFMRSAPVRFLLAAGLLAMALPAFGQQPKSTGEKLSLLRQIDEGFVAVFEKVAPSVVVIDATKKPDELEPDEGGTFEPFPEDGKEKREPQPRPRSRTWRLPQSPARSEASGFIFRADGYILTNLHVIAGAEKFSVRLRGGRILPAKLVAGDENTDIAVIKIEATGLPAVQMGDSDAVRVGQLVCAIGTPFSQDYSFTCGWISGKGRTNLLAPTSPTVLYEDYLQTDAFINPGNSGGPLFDVEGRVVGMNTLINGIGRGLAFAIPSNILVPVAEQLITNGRVVRPWLGIRIESLGQNPVLRERVTGIEEGVVVDTIEANAPAYQSDLRPADIITEVDGVPVANARDLQKEVLKKKVGDSLQLTIWRMGKFLKIPVVTGELPNEQGQLAAAARTPGTEWKIEDFGMKLRDVTGRGVQIIQVQPESPAAAAELQIDDFITGVENQPVPDSISCLAMLRSALSKPTQGPRGVLLTLERKGKRTFALLRIGEE